MQIEYALNTVEKGDPALGIKARNGVVIATEKKVWLVGFSTAISIFPHQVHSPLMDATAFKKIENLSKGVLLFRFSTSMKRKPKVGCVYAGMPTDYKVLLRQGRKRAQNYKAIYGDEIPCSQCTREVAGIMQVRSFSSLEFLGV